MKTSFIAVGLGLMLIANFLSGERGETAAAGDSTLDFSSSLLKDAGGLERFDKLLVTSLLSVDREKLIQNFTAEPPNLQRDCALFDLQLRSGRRKAAEQALDRILARPELAGSLLPANIIRFIIKHNLSKTINDTALAAKIYRKFPDPNLMELRDIAVHVGGAEGDIEVVKLLRPLPYTESAARAVEWWRPGLKQRGKVEVAAQRFQAAGREDLAKAVRGESVATVTYPAAPSGPQNAHFQVAQVQGNPPPPSTDPKSAEYWLEKARAANRENDIKTAENALARALTIAPVEPFGGRHSKGGTIRENVLSEYRIFLVKQQRGDEALAMLRKEVAGPGLNTYSGRYALKMLCQWELMAKEPAIKPGDEMLWQALAKSDKWRDEEKRCLDYLAGRSRQFPSAKSGAASPLWASAYATLERAKKMSEGADVSRKLVVAELWQAYGRPERAWPLLEAGLPQITDEREAADIRERLFQAYLEAGQPEAAEKIAPEVINRNLREALHYYFGGLALAWTKKGDKTRAMENWRKASNIDGTRIYSIRALSEAGLKPDLAKYYLEWQQADPESWVPPLALDLLNADKDTWIKTMEAN